MPLSLWLRVSVLQAFTAGYSTPKDNVHLLEELVGTRYEMAEVMGAPSYAHYTLNSATLAGCPEAVEDFLLELLAAIQPKVIVLLSITAREASHTDATCMSTRHLFDTGRGRDKYPAQVQSKAPWEVS